MDDALRVKKGQALEDLTAPLLDDLALDALGLMNVPGEGRSEGDFQSVTHRFTKRLALCVCTGAQGKRRRGPAAQGKRLGSRSGVSAAALQCTERPRVALVAAYERAPARRVCAAACGSSSSGGDAASDTAEQRERC